MKEQPLRNDDLYLKAEREKLMAHYFPANKILAVTGLFLLLIMSLMLASIINTVPLMRDRQERVIERVVRSEAQIKAIKLHVITLQNDRDIAVVNLQKEINRINILLNSR